MSVQVDAEILLQRAWTAREKAYAPYSKFGVGAALLTTSGNIFSGSNIENVSFGLTICAERTAAVAAVQAGQREFAAIAVVADTATPVVPCGACRQFLAEFNPALPIYSEGRAGRREEWSLSELLPSPKGGLLER